MAALIVACRQGGSQQPPAEGGPGFHAASITVDGRERKYLFYIPETHAGSESLPLVVGLHGGLGTPAQFAASSDFNRVAEAHGLVVVYPEGTGRTWNGGRCCGSAAREVVDDVAFVSALIEHFVRIHNVDRSRIYATGHSNGGIMAFRLACELSSQITAIAPVAASLELDDCAASRPVPVLAIHGDA